MSRKYTIGQVLENGLKIIDGPFKSNSKRNVKYLVECPSCKSSNLKYGNTLKNIKIGCFPCYSKSLRRTDNRPAFSKYYSSLKANAKSRNIDVNISLNDFIKIVSNDCYWCGLPPQPKSGFKEWQDVAWISGVDRKDNNLGYTIKNSVACCYDCNRAKSDLPLDLWKYWIVRIVNKNNDWVKKEKSFT